MNALKNRVFLLLFIGQLTSSLGDVLFKLALFWYVQETTGSAVYLSWLGLFITLPQFLSFFTGTLADHFQRTKIMFISDLVRCVLVLVLCIYLTIGSVSFMAIGVTVFFISILTNLFVPASRALVGEILDEEELPSGNGLMDSTIRFSTIISTMLGAILISYFKETTVFLFNAFTFIVSMITVIMMHKRIGHYQYLKDGYKSVSLHDWMAKCKEGLHFIRRFGFLKYTVPCGIVINIFFTIFLFLAPAWSEQVLDSGVFGFTLMEFALGFGMLCGSLSAGYFAKILNLNKGVAIAFGLQAIILLFPFMHSLAFGCSILLLFGFGNGLSNSLSSTVLQRLVPNSMQGRVFGSLASILGGIVPLGTIISSFLLQQYGITLTYFIGSIAIAIGSFYLMIVFYKEVWKTNNKNEQELSV